MAPTPSIALQSFTDEVRRFTRDHPELNRLISGVESSDRTIHYCITLAIDEWNSTPPLETRSLENFPSRFVLLYLTIIHLLVSASILKMRNKFRYVDGQWTSDTEPQAELYPQMIGLLRQQVAQVMRDIKVANNIASAWGRGVHSEYGWINGWYGYT